MIRLALTGSIGMGKSIAAEQLRSLGYPVFDADKAVHELYEDAMVRTRLLEAFPEFITPNNITRKNLGKYAETNPGTIPKLEKILHPLVRAKEQEFTAEWLNKGAKIAVYDIPLLFETGSSIRFDRIALVTAPYIVQLWRVVVGRRMGYGKFRRILALQMPDRDKRKHAHYIVHTGWGSAFSLRQWEKVMASVSAEKDKDASDRS